ncbi:hypothetical protein [Streptomyces sp. NPDC059378]|uniref:hypothetical protein n=1 Tax=Streptomyces sp. NPDC059378 TaxID=3346815 RepID=UPI0036A92D7A
MALHRYLEGIIPVSREWPVDTRRMMQQDPEARERRDALSERLNTFLRRATAEGHLRADVDADWTRAALGRLVDTVAHDFPSMDAPRAADLVADTFLHGLGAR